MARKVAVTPEMIEAGAQILWRGPDAPQFVRDQAMWAYIAMETARRDADAEGEPPNPKPKLRLVDRTA